MWRWREAVSAQASPDAGFGAEALCPEPIQRRNPRKFEAFRLAAPWYRPVGGFGIALFRAGRSGAVTRIDVPDRDR